MCQNIFNMANSITKDEIRISDPWKNFSREFDTVK